jgi:hypothetical protein
MKEIRPVVSRVERTARILGLKDAGRGGSACPRHRPIHGAFGPAGEAVNEASEFDAAAQWWAHIEARRIGLV